MKFNYKKIASVASSVLMVGSTVALAAAANFPAPFKNDGYAIVYGGSNAASTDLASAIDIAASLSSATSTSSSGTTTSSSGESFGLFTGSSELFLNASLNSVYSTLTDSELPTILAEGTFEGTTSTQYTQKILLGGNPSITFAKMPSSDDDPKIGLTFSTNPTTTPLYNATVVFDSNVNFSDSDSVGEDLELFGQSFTIGAGTTTSKLVLLKNSESIDLSSDVNPSQSITVEGSQYTIELIAATDTSATIKVTDSTGRTDSKEITESTSKKVLGLEVSVDRADENNFRLTATVSIGSNRITLQDGSAVKIGSDEDTLDGTNVEFYLTNGTQTTYPGAIGKIDFQVAAPDSDEDAIFPGNVFNDPIFGSFKIDFAGVNYPEDDTSRETITVENSGNDKMTVTFQSHDSSEAKKVEFVYNKTTAEGLTAGSGLGGMILGDSDGDPIRTTELVNVNKSQYVVIGSDDYGGLYEVKSIHNDSSTATDDYVTLSNVFTGQEKEFKASTEGVITATLEGKTYTITYSGASTAAQETMQARFNNPESSTSTQVILFPTIATESGAKVAFYQPTRLNMTGANFGLAAPNNITSISFPDGDGYTSFAIVNVGADGSASSFNYTIGGSVLQFNATNTGSGVTGTVGKLIYNFTGTGTADSFNVYLTSPDGGNIVRPALVVFEEEDDANNYEAVVVTMDAGYDGGNNDIGVNDIVRTWGSDTQLGNELQLETDNDMYQDADIWGSIFTLDKSDSDQQTAKISYPDNQVEAEIYVAESDATISSGGTGGTTTAGSVSVKDSEIQQVATKNLIVVGGSCVNTVAATLLGSTSPLCGSAFEAATTVGSGSFLIQTFASPYSASKIATLVAGYNAADTTNAATYLRTQTVDTTVGKKYIGTSATQATLQTSTA